MGGEEDAAFSKCCIRFNICSEHVGHEDIPFDQEESKTANQSQQNSPLDSNGIIPLLKSLGGGRFHSPTFYQAQIYSGRDSERSQTDIQSTPWGAVAGNKQNANSYVSHLTEKEVNM